MLFIVQRSRARTLPSEVGGGTAGETLERFGDCSSDLNRVFRGYGELVALGANCEGSSTRTRSLDKSDGSTVRG